MIGADHSTPVLQNVQDILQTAPPSPSRSKHRDGRTRAQAQSGVLAAPPPPSDPGAKPLPPAASSEAPGYPRQRPRLSQRVSGQGPVPSLTSEGRLVSLGRGQLQVPGHRQGIPHSTAKEALPGLCHLLMRAPQRRRGLNRPMSAEGRSPDEGRGRPRNCRVGSRREISNSNNALPTGRMTPLERAC